MSQEPKAENVRILLVDDEPEVTEILRRALATEGWQTVAANHPRQAMDLFSAERPQVVLCDVKMPGGDGLELLGKMLALDETVAVVMVTAMHDLELAVEAMRLGACDYLTKPFALEQVRAHVRSAIGWHRLRSREKLYEEELTRQVLLRTAELQDANQHLRDTSLQVIRVLANIVEVKDPFTLGHSERVACYSRELARAMGIEPVQQERIQIASLLHDIGKLGIEDAILLKPGPLTWEEQREMRRHPTIGRALLEPIQLAPEIKQYAYAHHERHDGKGYPEGMSGEAIPVGARILIISEVFDALTTERAYKPAWPLAKALAYVRHNIGKHFHPAAAEVLLRLVAERGEQFLKEASFRFEPMVSNQPLGIWQFSLPAGTGR